MRKVLGLTVLAPFPAMACPACDFGGRDAAAFILLIFGLFIVGYLTIFLRVWKRNGIATANNRASDALQAEGIDTQEEK